MAFKYFLVFVFLSLVAGLIGIAALPRLGLARANSEMVWVAYLYDHKEHIAASIDGPRVFVVGGSATLHSFDSATASHRLGIPVVNFGTHASMGLDYLLERAKRVMRPGDIILLAPEYDLLQQSDQPSSYRIQLVTFYDRDYIWKAPLRNWASYIFGYDVIPSIAEALKVKLRGPTPIPFDLVQDNFGNNRGYTVARSIGRQQLPTLTPVLPRPITTQARNALMDFSADAAARHIKVFVMPVTLIHSDSYLGRGYERYLATLPSAYASMGLTVIGTPEMAFLTPEEIHDVPFHANDLGRARYTAAMLDELCKHLVCRR